MKCSLKIFFVLLFFLLNVGKSYSEDKISYINLELVLQDSIYGKDSGILVEPFDVCEYANALRSLLDKKDKLNPRQYILKYNNEKKIDQSYKELYYKILNKSLG